LLTRSSVWTFPCSAAAYTLFERRNAYAIADVACSIGYAKGEYGGLACRDDAMQAWPVSRPAAAALDADLPIVDRDHRDSRAG
jgi:hypothetical protein